MSVSEQLQRYKNKRRYRSNLLKGTAKTLHQYQHGPIRDIDLEAVLACKQDIQNTITQLSEYEEEAFSVLEEHPDALEKEIEAQEKFKEEYAPLLKMITRLTELSKTHAAYRKLQIEGEQFLKLPPSPALLTSHTSYVSACTDLLANDDKIIDHAEIATDHVALEKLMDQVKLHLYPAPGEGEDEDERATTPTHHEAPLMYGARLTIDVPDFNGQPRAWPKFKEMFEVVLESRGRYLSNIEKRILLEKCMTTQDAKDTIIRNYSGEDPFNRVMKALDSKYGDPRVLLPLLVREITQDHDTYDFTREGLQSLYDKYVLIYEQLQDLIKDSLTVYMCQCAREHFSPKLREEWDKHAGTMSSLPTIKTLGEFVDKFVRQMEPSTVPSKPRSHTATSAPTGSTAMMMKCPFCKGAHPPHRCPAFLAKQVDDRHLMVREARICLNCLRPGHTSRQCASKMRCKTCNKPHHSMLHLQKETPPKAKPTPTAAKVSITPLMKNNTPTLSFIDTVTVDVSHDGRQMRTRAALDSGAGLSMMSEHLANALKLPRHKQRVAFEGIRGKGISKTYVTVKLTSPHDVTKSMEVSLHVIPHLKPVHQPMNAAGILQHPAMQDLQLSDPHLGGHIDILLGNLDRSTCITGASMMLPDSKITLTPTLFGWSVAGPLDGQVPDILQTTAQPEELYQLLKQQWELEKVPDAPQHAQDRVTRHFYDTHTRQDDGRYVVRLPQVPTPPTLGKSRARALKRYVSNEQSLKKKGTYDAFLSVLREYVTLGHAEGVPRPLDESSMYYLPVHGVIKETSTTTKLRAVFDASAPSSNGHSLNDTLEAGPNLYPALPDVLIRFRSHRIALTADVGKMFREILLHPADRDLHRFLIRTPDGHIQDYRMLRLTFGVKSSPFLATQVLRHLASVHESSYVHASQVITRDFYVDDCLTGVDTLDEALKLRQDLNHVLMTAGMTLRKWRSNDESLLDSIPDDLKETSGLSITASHDVPKALGIHWDCTKDVLHVSTPVDLPKGPTTKRVVASLTAQVFDILGLMAPAIVPARILLQSLWRSSLAWDDPLPDDVVQRWDQWTSQLSHITQCSIPRRMTTQDSPVIFRALHGFSDASSVAYGAAVYLRTVHDDGSVQCTLVTAKARVLPLKPITIPRAELVAASLLTKLLTHVAGVLGISRHDLYAWTDSAIVLHWLHKSPSALKTFVRNRISHMQDHLPASHWRHVSTEDNPADLLSRGCTALELQANSLWWHGPPWLLQDPAMWKTKQVVRISKPVPEVKSPEVSIMMTQSTTDSPWSQCSSYGKATLAYAWARRFMNNARRSPRSRDLSPHLSSDEISHAKNMMILQAQQESFPELYHDKKLPHGHFLSKYNVHPPEKFPYYVISGRIKKKILIPLRAKSALTRLMLRHYHHVYGHPGTETLMAILHDTYLIQGARSVLKKLSKECVTCQRSFARPLQARMSALPEVRTTPAPPFTHVGLDFAGPFRCKRGHTRKPLVEDCYVCLFICMTTRAVHLDICQDLSTNEFLATLRRFMARRGVPSSIYSDNGTNFVGANTAIRQFLRDTTTKETLKNVCAKYDLTWRFITPRAPHMGGLWEAGVRIMKSLLRKVVQPHPLRSDELYTVLTEVEATMNSRPIAPLHGDGDPDQLILTPGHFLVLRPLKAPPFPEELSPPTNMSYTRRWTLVQQILQTLWEKWLQSYLQSRFARSKWQKTSKDINVGDIVLVKDVTLKRRTWPLGKVTRTFPGSDGTVRTVEVLCHGKTYTRAVHLLCPLLSSDTSGLAEPLALLSRAPEAVEDHDRPANVMYATTYQSQLTSELTMSHDGDELTIPQEDDDVQTSKVPSTSHEDEDTASHGPQHAKGPPHDSIEVIMPLRESVQDAEATHLMGSTASFHEPSPRLYKAMKALYGTQEKDYQRGHAP